MVREQDKRHFGEHCLFSGSTVYVQVMRKH